MATPAPFRLYNTLTKQTEPFVPLQEGAVSLYVCGMTVYDHIHIGHGRAMVAFDAFVRYLRHRGWAVRFVRNFTDIDDKIIRRALERGEEPLALAQRYIDAFHEDTDALGLARPDVEPRVSTSMEAILHMTEHLIAKGHAYEADGSVWFSVQSFPEYGKLSRQRVDELRSADEESGKRHPADFALWKACKPGEPTWPSPWGQGRPGWHIECSAMSREQLGAQIDIHGGGLDLVFPHHENEVAQSECASGEPFARYWMHNGLITMASGQKMGKSLGNVFNIREALAVFPAEALRLYLLQNHYRTALPWSETSLTEALSMLARLYEAKEVAGQLAREPGEAQESPAAAAQALGEDAAAALALAEGFEARLYGALDEDFNTAQALALAFELARAVNRLAGHKRAKRRAGPIAALALAAFERFSAALHLLGAAPGEFTEEVKRKRLAPLGLTAEEVEGLLAARAAARAAKDWAESDRLRDLLDARGVAVMDTPAGAEWRVKL
ncbi:MAG: cysteine--tRNA ligase [Deltaproteobacteria bacterium]|nr:cysteine--tRNA ligase [Deltaproteobacteria bacterium]